MKPSPTDWQAVAQAKLASVLGPLKGTAAMTEALRALELQRLETATDLQRLAEHLITTGGFAGAVGGLLSVHAALYGKPEASEQDAELSLERPSSAGGSGPPA